MNRLHVHLKVEDLSQSIAFYSALFGRRPDKQEADYAKWMLEDPRANIAISTRGDGAGVDHVGLQTDTPEELEAIARRLKDADVGLFEEANATCCYAKSDKYWTASPDGAKWELYHTFGDSPTFGASPSMSAIEKAASGACCGGA
ncbi:MAG: ArsI/CadI family heavy metal resistance metalloenzyme [Parvularculaceae bacterium]|nr:VOC family protein [Parvularculaceae bacterium]